MKAMREARREARWGTHKLVTSYPTAPWASIKITRDWLTCLPCARVLAAAARGKRRKAQAHQKLAGWHALCAGLPACRLCSRGSRWCLKTAFKLEMHRATTTTTTTGTWQRLTSSTGCGCSCEKGEGVWPTQERS